MHSGEYNVFDVTLSVYPDRVSGKVSLPGVHGYTLRVTSKTSTYLSYELKKFHRSRVQEVITVFIAFKTIHNGVKEFPFDNIAIIEFIFQTNYPTTTAQGT